MKKISSTTIKAKLKDLYKRGFLVLSVLMLIVIVSSSSLIAVNFYTIKLFSALRGFIVGESEYSKAQKDGVHHLQMYLNTLDESYYSKYKEDLKINLGDSLARVGLNTDDAEINIARNFISARNDSSNVYNMIWMVKNFREVSFLHRGIQVWAKADVLIGVLDQKAEVFHSMVQKHQINPLILKSFRNEIEEMNLKIAALETNFTKILSKASGEIGTGLFWSNLIMTFCILGATGIYSAISIRKLISSQANIYSQNQSLTETNKELDRFVYSASHDLRAPLTSLKGLLQIIKEEENPDEIKNYLKMMDESLEKQDEFIREIIDYSRNKRTHVTICNINLEQVIDEAFSQHQFLSVSAELNMQKELQVVEMNTDLLRLKIVINNLISNAIKYCDMEKAIRYVIVRTDMVGNNVRIQVVDNGIGIAEKYLDKIFDMFFVTQHSNRGSGVGLYITKESIEKIKGSISVKSEPGRGTTFTVLLPMNLKLEKEKEAEIHTIKLWPNSGALTS